MIALLIATSLPAQAVSVTLRMPVYPNGQHEFFFELITKALKEDGHDVTLESVFNHPHLRERDMLALGDLNVLWLVRSQKRDATYIPVPVKLTNGLIGKRILLVPQKHKENYKDVKTLDDFRNLGKVAGLGKKWFDVKVWTINALPKVEIYDWRLVYKIIDIGDRGVDYFPRGFNEILSEHHANSYLAIEPHLILQYDRDFIFYVSPKTPGLAPMLERAMKKAKASGLIDRLVHKHWAHNFEVLKPETRTIIHMATPK
jgi:hypothetical protein